MNRPADALRAIALKEHFNDLATGVFYNNVIINNNHRNATATSFKDSGFLLKKEDQSLVDQFVVTMNKQAGTRPIQKGEIVEEGNAVIFYFSTNEDVQKKSKESLLVEIAKNEASKTKVFMDKALKIG
jgi:hypothetical protein